jgi:hypothetical protein
MLGFISEERPNKSNNFSRRRNLRNVPVDSSAGKSMIFLSDLHYLPPEMPGFSIAKSRDTGMK